MEFIILQYDLSKYIFYIYYIISSPLKANMLGIHELVNVAIQCYIALPSENNITHLFSIYYLRIYLRI